MTVSTTNNRIPYSGNGSTTAFAFPYKFIAKTDIKVYVAGTLLTSGYTVGEPSDTGANVTFTVAPASGAPIVLLCDPDMLQASALPGTGPFPSVTVERMSDKLTLIAQRLRDLINRSMTLPDSFAGSASTVLPTPAANKVIGWNSTGDTLVNLNAADLATTVIGATNVIDPLSGTGVQKNFTLSADPLNINNIDVYVSGVRQAKANYSLSGTTLSFVTAPPAGTGNIEVKQAQAMTYPVTTLADGSVKPSNLSVDFGAWVTAATAALARAALGLGTAALAAASSFAAAGAATGSGLTMATGKLLGRTTASSGAIEEISVGTGLSLSAGTLSATSTISATQLAKAWVNWDGTLTGTITPRANLNIASVTKNGTGDYTVNIGSSVLADANYAWSGSAFNTANNGVYMGQGTVTTTHTATALRVITYAASTPVDATRAEIIIFGN